ncbi:MAG TPA: sigma-70 family RNA polymerase sigma factor [Blastocatellia bacterium]|jgi:RNA polymerase sigma-70 factor (ECF subfamily)|nr:sigma-70 family RNA polymerase sigma factor [Blastocatellia bacterium]
MSNDTDWLDWVRRITQGDSAAEAELIARYRDGVAIIIGRIVRNESATEDLTQETFRISLEKIRGGDVRAPERLSGFICGVARNVAIEYVRRIRRLTNHEEIGAAEQIRDPRPDQFEQLLSKERAEVARQAISELKVERDREILFRYYIAEQDKDQICADLGLSHQQFNSIIFRALKRYKELYLKRFGKL